MTMAVGYPLKGGNDLMICPVCGGNGKCVSPEAIALSQPPYLRPCGLCGGTRHTTVGKVWLLHEEYLKAHGGQG